VTMYVQISEINPANHTVLANVTLYMHNFPENMTTNVLVRFENDDSYEVNCSRVGDPVNGTYDYKGEIDGKYWYLVTYGELYPSDLNFVNLKLNPDYLVGSINGTTYNPNWKYSFNVVDGAVNFYGFQWADFQNTWTTSPVNSGERLIIYFQRKELNPQYLIIAPLVWFLTLVASLPLLSANKTTKIQFYSSILVFAPIFIFAIQNFIPPRNSLSIPEYLSFILILSSTLMLIMTLPKYKNEKHKRNSEVVGLGLSMVISYALGLLLYWKFLFLAETTLTISVVLIVLTLIFGIMAIFRELSYRRYVKIEESLEY